MFFDYIGAIDGTHILATVPVHDQIWVSLEGTAHDTHIVYEAFGRHDLCFPHPPPGLLLIVWHNNVKCILYID